MRGCDSVRHRNLGQNFLTGTVSSALGGLSKLTGTCVSRAICGAIDRPRIRVSNMCAGRMRWLPRAHYAVICQMCRLNSRSSSTKRDLRRCSRICAWRSIGRGAPSVVQVDVRQPAARNIAARSFQPHTAEYSVSAAVRTSRPLHAVCRLSACSFTRALARSARLSADSRQVCMCAVGRVVNDNGLSGTLPSLSALTVLRFL